MKTKSKPTNRYASQPNTQYQVYVKFAKGARFRPRCVVEADAPEDALRLARLAVPGDEAIIKVVQFRQMHCHHKDKDTGVLCDYNWNHKGLRQYATCPNCYKQVKVK